MRSLRFTLPLLIAALLTGCGDSGSSPTFRKIAGAVRGQFGAHKSGPPLAMQLTRAQVRAVKAPLLRASIPKFHTATLLSIYARNGNVITWADGAQDEVSTRNGIVVATHGLPGDLTSADLPGLTEIARGTGTVSARYWSLDSLDQARLIRATCTLSTLGEETITIIGLTYKTRHIGESCESPAGAFQNEFWIGPGPVMRKSLQWVGPFVGQILLENLAE